jgi:hypothetical protein
MDRPGGEETAMIVSRVVAPAVTFMIAMQRGDQSIMRLILPLTMFDMRLAGDRQIALRWVLKTMLTPSQCRAH